MFLYMNDYSYVILQKWRYKECSISTTNLKSDKMNWRNQPMAKDRLEPCESYICKGQCKKGRDADHSGYCQKCGKYRPRVRKRHINRKKQELEKIRKEERY